jgi:hypothetical protein
MSCLPVDPCDPCVPYEISMDQKPCSCYNKAISHISQKNQPKMEVSPWLPMATPDGSHGSRLSRIWSLVRANQRHNCWWFSVVIPRRSRGHLKAKWMGLDGSRKNVWQFLAKENPCWISFGGILKKHDIANKEKSWGENPPPCVLCEFQLDSGSNMFKIWFQHVSTADNKTSWCLLQLLFLLR